MASRGKERGLGVKLSKKPLKQTQAGDLDDKADTCKHTCVRAHTHTHTHTHTRPIRQSGHHFTAFTQCHSAGNAKSMKTKFSQASS